MMVFRRGNDEFTNLFSILLLTGFVLLTVFSIFYSNIYSPKITGYQVGVSICSGNEECGSGEVCIQDQCIFSYGMCETYSDCGSGQTCIQNYCILNLEQEDPPEGASSPSPPPQYIAEISRGANQVSQGASYASNINSIILADSSISEQDLRRYITNLEATLYNSVLVYGRSTQIVSTYSSTELDQYYSSIIQSIDTISEVVEALDDILSEKVGVRQEAQLEQAQWVVEREVNVENSVEALQEYTAEIIPLGDLTVEPQVEGSESSEFIQNNCEYPVPLAVFDDQLIDFGYSGVDSSNGKICQTEAQIVYDAAASSSRMRSFVIPEINEIPAVEALIGSESVVALHFEERGGSNYRENVGVVIFKDRSSLLNIRFFTSPTYYGIEKKISDFIHDLFFKGENVESSELILTESEASLVVQEAKSVPWLLWSILCIMVISFFLFGKLLVFDHKRLIIKGRTALNRKDYLLAVKIYNDIIEIYNLEKSDSMKQDILEYSVLLKKAGENNNLNLNINSGSFSKIKYSPSLGSISSDLSRVERMIRDALSEIKSNPKVANVRMPIIAEAYRNLDSKSRDKIASLYESLVYSLRDLK